jgi:hypothetical protein
MAIRFTQFMFPDGTPRMRTLEASHEVEGLAQELIEAGWVFEVECHPDTQVVSGDCCDDEQQLGMFSEQNGPGVPPAVEAMVLEAWATWVQRGKPRAKNPGGGSRFPNALAREAREQGE